MTKQAYEAIVDEMHRHVDPCVHDSGHIFRVLFCALDIAQTEEGVDRDILIAACLLHDVARSLEDAGDTTPHAVRGAEMAHAFLTGLG